MTLIGPAYVTAAVPPEMLDEFPVSPLSDPLPKSQSPADVVNVMPFAPPVDDVLLKVAVPDGVAAVTLIAIPLDDTLVFVTVKPVMLFAANPVAAVEIAIAVDHRAVRGSSPWNWKDPAPPPLPIDGRAIVPGRRRDAHQRIRSSHPSRSLDRLATHLTLSARPVAYVPEYTNTRWLAASTLVGAVPAY